MTHTLCLLQKPDKFFKDLLHCQWCKAIDNSTKILSTWFGHELWTHEKLFQISLKARWQTSRMNCHLSNSFLVKAHKTSLSKVPPVIYTTHFMKYRDRNERKSKKQNPNMWLIVLFFFFLIWRSSIYLFIPNWHLEKMFSGCNLFGIRVSIKNNQNNK